MRHKGWKLPIHARMKSKIVESCNREPKTHSKKWLRSKSYRVFSLRISWGISRETTCKCWLILELWDPIKNWAWEWILCLNSSVKPNTKSLRKIKTSLASTIFSTPPPPSLPVLIKPLSCVRSNVKRKPNSKRRRRSVTELKRLSFVRSAVTLSEKHTVLRNSPTISCKLLWHPAIKLSTQTLSPCMMSVSTTHHVRMEFVLSVDSLASFC